MLNPKEIRRKIIHLAYQAQSGHLGCALSLVEILCFLHDSFPNETIVLSKGHGAMALYCIQHELGILQDHQMKDYLKNGSELFGTIPGFGSLGHGLSVALGMALANPEKKVFCIVGDGEMQEGSSLETIHYIEQNRVYNLYLIIDGNGWQAMQKVKYPQFFSFPTILVDGHKMDQCKVAMDLGYRLFFAKTVKGKGISFMEDNNEWHYSRLTPGLYSQALKELD